MKLAIVVIALLHAVCSKPTSTDLEGFQNDNQDYQDYGEEPEIPEETDAPSDDKPMITSKSQTLTRNISETVRLPCEITGSNYVRIWRKKASVENSGIKDSVLFQADIPMAAAPNMVQLKDGTLEISNLHIQDAGEYECAAMDTEKNSPKITHTLLLSTPPRIELLTARDNVTTLKSGEDLTLTCKASGFPSANISWHKGAERLDIEGETLTIYKVRHHNAGTYSCLADNKIGQPSVAAINIKVQFKPLVTIERLGVSSESNLNTELECVVHAEPPANVTWKKDGGDVPSDGYRVKFRIEGHHHFLIINDLDDSDFGNYTCAAENFLGETKRFISLAKTPAIFDFKLRAEGKNAVLTWQVQSKSSVLQHEIQYRKQGETSWTSVVVPMEQTSSDGTQLLTHRLHNVLESGLYELRIRTENGSGWSDYSETKTVEEAHVKHGHHKSHKKGHKHGAEKQTTPTQETTTQANLPINQDAPAEQSDSAKESTREVGMSSALPSIASKVSLFNIALFTFLQVQLSKIRI